VGEAKAGRNWRVKYLTKEEFELFKDNDFLHLVRDVKSVKRWQIAMLVGVVLVPFGLLYAFYQILSLMVWGVR